MSDKGRYVPPHLRRGNNENGLKDETERKRAHTNSYYNKHQDDSQESKFNTRTISPSDICGVTNITPGPIEIPEIVIPPIVKPVIKSNNRKLSKPKSSSEYDLDLFKKLSSIQIEIKKREEKEDFEEWVKHYKKDLEEMYDNCIDGDNGILYESFVRLAYECTEKEYNRKKFKYARPLI